MAEAGIGVDIVEIPRMEEILRRTPSFATRMFTDEERAYCDAKARPAAHYACRFAAREAVLKALGTGFGEGISRKDVSVSRNQQGRPSVVLAGRAREVADELGVVEVPSRSLIPINLLLRMRLPSPRRLVLSLRRVSVTSAL